MKLVRPLAIRGIPPKKMEQKIVFGMEQQDV